MAKKSSRFIRVLINLLTVIPSIVNVAHSVVKQVEVELKQAKRSLIILFILTLFALILLFGAWICVCGLLFLWLITLLNPIGTFSVLLGLHIVLLIIIGLWMNVTKNNLLFTNTRKLLHFRDPN